MSIAFKWQEKKEEHTHLVNYPENGHEIRHLLLDLFSA